MTIRNLDAFVGALWDWGFLDKCFGDTRIRVSDLDGIVERNGEFLVIEAKGPTKDIPRGQQRMFAALAARGFTILIIWGDANQPREKQVWYPHFSKPTPRASADKEAIIEFVSKWFVYVNENLSRNKGSHAC